MSENSEGDGEPPPPPITSSLEDSWDPPGQTVTDEAEPGTSSGKVPGDKPQDSSNRDMSSPKKQDSSPKVTPSIRERMPKMITMSAAFEVFSSMPDIESPSIESNLLPILEDGEIQTCESQKLSSLNEVDTTTGKNAQEPNLLPAAKTIKETESLDLGVHKAKAQFDIKIPLKSSTSEVDKIIDHQSDRERVPTLILLQQEEIDSLSDASVEFAELTSTVSPSLDVVPKIDESSNSPDTVSSSVDLIPEVDESPVSADESRPDSIVSKNDMVTNTWTLSEEKQPALEKESPVAGAAQGETEAAVALSEDTQEDRGIKTILTSAEASEKAEIEKLNLDPQITDDQPLKPDKNRVTGKDKVAPRKCEWKAGRRVPRKRRSCLKATSSDRSPGRRIQFAEFDKIRVFSDTMTIFHIRESFIGNSKVPMKTEKLSQEAQDRRLWEIQQNLKRDWDHSDHEELMRAIENGDEDKISEMMKLWNKNDPWDNDEFDISGEDCNSFPQGPDADNDDKPEDHSVEIMDDGHVDVRTTEPVTGRQESTLHDAGPIRSPMRRGGKLRRMIGRVVRAVRSVKRKIPACVCCRGERD